MECAICKRTEEEIELFEGIFNEEIAKICKRCAELDDIPLIKHPTPDQLVLAEKRDSVRERMEKLSGLRKEPISKEHEIALKNLSKLRIPEQKQENEKLVDNYYWVVQRARRKKGNTIKHLSIETGIPAEKLESFEKGVLSEDFEDIAERVESALEIRLLKSHHARIHVIPTEEQEKEILEQVKERMRENKGRDVKKISPEEKKQRADKIFRGELDFSKKENIENITLNDLIELKKQKEKREKQKQEKQKHEELFGEDLEVAE